MNPGVIALLIPILVLMIPIVAILTAHQQKMAQIIHSGQGARAANDAEIDALKREIRELKQIVHQQAIAMDTFLDRQTKLSADRGDVATRLAER